MKLTKRSIELQVKTDDDSVLEMQIIDDYLPD